MKTTKIDDSSLSKLTTFRIGGNACSLYMPENKDNLLEILNNIDYTKEKPLILGNGSNVLVSSQGYDGTVISTKNLENIVLADESTIYAESGVKTPVLSAFAAKNNLTGLEFLTGIPGTTGGAVIMNCSAHAQALEDTIIEAEIYDWKTKKVIKYSKSQLKLEYRKSAIDPETQVVISAVFKLHKSTNEAISKKINEIISFRKEKQPKGFNAGSMFKNPPGINSPSAGYLLDQAGVKGWLEGGAEVSRVHANFINNVNEATSTDVSRLMLRMHKAVKEHSGYILRPEVKFIGKQTEEEEKIWKILVAQ